MQLKDICSPGVIFCVRNTSTLQAARLMRENHVGDLVVVDDPESERLPVGIITDRDIVVRVLGNDLDPATTPVSAAMHTPVVLASEHEDASQAAARMRMHGVRRLPVTTDAGKLVGIVTLDDLLQQLAAEATQLLSIISKGRDLENRSYR